MFEQAREYLARVVQWPQEGEETSYVNLHWTEPNLYDPKKKPFFRGKPFTDVGSAINHLEYLTTKGNALDIYVCMSSQRTHEIKRNASTGKEFTIAVRGQGTAVKIKSLFIDLDAKGEDKNSYADVIEASKALAKFLQDTGLPKPSLLVFSGGGLHVYWTLMLALDPAAWTPLAYALAEATKRHGLKCDTQVTIDSARVLRVPGTKNHKPGLVSDGKVRIAGKPQDFDYANERIERVLEPYKVSVPKLVTTEARDFSLFPVRAPLKEPSALAMGVDTSKYDPLDLDLILPECPWLRDTVTTGGKDNPNPLWNLTNLVAVFCKDGRSQAHRLGCQHNAYSQEDTDEQYDRKVEEQKKSGLGWPSCQAISTTGAKQCQGCPHLQKQKSPLSFGIQKTIPTTVTSNTVGVSSSSITTPNTNDLPNGYTRRHDGIILENITLPDNTIKQSEVSAYPIIKGWLSEQPEELNFHTVLKSGNPTKHISIILKEVNGMGMRGTLQAQGFMLEVGKGAERFGRFLMSWVKKMQETRDSVKSESYGWDIENGKFVGFAYDDTVWTPTGSKAASRADPVLRKKYSPAGERGPWDAAAKLVTDQGRPGLEALLAAGFAGPLVGITGHSGCILNAWSESGKGKSTTIDAAQAIWGASKAKQGLNDKPLQMFNKMGKLRAIPLFWDEIKGAEECRGLSKLLFLVTRGVERGRLNSDISMRESGEWDTMLVTATNESILEYVVEYAATTEAGLYRTFEYELAPATTSKGQIVSSEAQLITAKLNHNYGHVGLAYAKWLGANHAQVYQDMRKFQSDLITRVNSIKEERFWIATISCLCLGAKYANQLGFTKFDEPALEAFMLTVLDSMRDVIGKQPIGMVRQDNIVNTLGQFISEMQAKHMVITNKIHTSAGPPGNSIQVIGNTQYLDGVHVQFGMDDGLIRISFDKLGEWFDAKKNKGTRGTFVKKLKEQFGAVEKNAIMGAGTNVSISGKFKQNLIQLDLKGHPALKVFLDMVGK